MCQLTYIIEQFCHGLHLINETRRDHIGLIYYKWYNLYKIKYENKGHRPKSKENGHQNINPTKGVEVIEPLNEYVSKPPTILALLGLWGLSTSHIPVIYLQNPTHFGPSHPTSKYFDPYHKSNKWRFGWLSHVIQGYKTGIFHHISARERVATMHITRSSWCCYCSARPTHCSNYETGLHSLHRQPGRCHWILSLAAQSVDGHEGSLSRSKS